MTTTDIFLEVSEAMKAVFEEHYGESPVRTIHLPLMESRWRHLIGVLRRHGDMGDILKVLLPLLEAEGMEIPVDKDALSRERIEESRQRARDEAAELPDIERGETGIKCECGGYAELVDCTEDECAAFGCGRDTPGNECCAVAFVCGVCGKRYAGAQPAPEMG